MGMRFIDRTLREGEHASLIISFSGGGELILGPIARDTLVSPSGDVSQLEADGYVAVQGRQTEYDRGRAIYTMFPHERAGKSDKVVHFFDPSLNNLDISINFNPNKDKTSEELQRISADIVGNIQTSIEKKFGRDRIIVFTDSSGHYALSTKQEILTDAVRDEGMAIARKTISVDPDNPQPIPLTEMVMDALRHGRAIKVLVDLPEEDEKNLRADFSFPREANIRSCVAQKDCKTFLFEGIAGKKRIKDTILNIVDRLEKGEKVYVFCHQGKDRSAAIMLGVLLYLAKCKSKDDPKMHNQIMRFLRSKRAIVNDDFYLQANGEPVPGKMYKLYLQYILPAVAELIDGNIHERPEDLGDGGGGGGGGGSK